MDCSHCGSRNVITPEIQQNKQQQSVIEVDTGAYSAPASKMGGLSITRGIK